jgi:hypothetical protein
MAPIAPPEAAPIAPPFCVLFKDAQLENNMAALKIMIVLI